MEKGKVKTTAILLAAGGGRRMGGSVKKQYLLLAGKPIISYSLQVFQESFIDEIILAAAPGDVDYCRQEIVEKYGFTKVRHIVEGGKERYHSVANCLRQLEDCDYVFIHDGARPLVSEEILQRAYQEVLACDACVVGMPVKDTIKIANEKGYIAATPDRSRLWMVQTPQVFRCELIRAAYGELLLKEEEILQKETAVTDDAMVVEMLLNHPVKLVEGSYENIKVTTPEDLKIAETFIENRCGKRV